LGDTKKINGKSLEGVGAMVLGRYKKDKSKY
jgi:hypothetical protein